LTQFQQSLQLLFFTFGTEEEAAKSSIKKEQNVLF